MSAAQKRAQLAALARKRRDALRSDGQADDSRWSGYKGIGDYHGGVYECEFVSPYTKAAGNVDSPYFVMLQDWSCDATLSGPIDEPSRTIGHSPQRETNKNLKRLLLEALDVDLAEIYATNLFPFVKLGPMNAPIPQKDLVRAAHEFGLPQVRIVRPRLVICLGEKTYRAVRAACGRNRVYGTGESIRSPFDFEGARIWCQAHTSQQGQNNRNRGGVDRVHDDWGRMKGDLR